jgi:tripartite-type tricarboxylate transporter receptor subunit TctC
MGTTGTHTTNPAVFSKLPYDPLKDFAPISLVAESPFVLLVHPSLPVRSVKDLIALPERDPDSSPMPRPGPAVPRISDSSCSTSWRG